MHFYAVHYISFKISWFTYVVANIRKVPKWIQFAGCNSDLVI